MIAHVKVAEPWETENITRLLEEAEERQLEFWGEGI